MKTDTRRTGADQLLLNVLTVVLLLAVMTLAVIRPALSCGWWGDGEDDDGDAITIGADGQPISETKSNPDQTITPNVGGKNGPRLPSRLEVPSPRTGYGLTVRSDGSAAPYLETVSGSALYSIQQLQQAGFPAVIDLGTPAATAALHRKETEEVGMKYFNIPIEGDIPSKEEVALFSDILSKTEQLPVLVYSASSDLLGVMWALHRLNEGATKKAVISEGEGLGLSEFGVRIILGR